MLKIEPRASRASRLVVNEAPTVYELHNFEFK